MQTAPAVYLTFWGWSTGSDPVGEAQYLQNFLAGIGGRGWNQVVTQYCQGVAGGSASCASGSTRAGNPGGMLKGVWWDSSAVPLTPSDADIANEATNSAIHFGNGTAPPNAQFVIATPTLHSTLGFTTQQYCAYHGATGSPYGTISYTNLPYQSDAGPGCGMYSVNAGPAGLLDGVSIVEGHELAETETDPQINAWFDGYGEEIGDKCAWAGLTNVSLATGTFAVQPLWSNPAGTCSMSGAPRRDVVMLPSGTGGYTLDGWGDVTAFAVGNAAMPPPASGFLQWPGWDIARRIVLLASGTGGYVLDGWGGIHPFAVGSSPMPLSVTGNAYWSGWDIARGMVLTPDNTGGYVLDGWGGIHPFAVGPAPAPAGAVGYAYWSGWDIARNFVLVPGGTGGYTLDGWGGVHPFAIGSGSMPPGTTVSASWPGWDIARNLVLVPGGTGGYTLDGYGNVHPFAIGSGAMPPGTNVSGYWSGSDIARGLVLLPTGTGGYVVNTYGDVAPFAVGSDPMPPAAME